MKLKYYLRGLGIGIILTTLILTISRVNHKMSDQEIINKAMELGMVMKEDPKGNLDEVLGGKDSENSDTSEGQPSQAPEDELTPSATPSGTPADELTPAATPSGTPAEVSPAASYDPGTQSGDQTNDQTPATDDNTDTTQATQEQGTGEADTATPADISAGSEEITFTIMKGMSSGKVAALLESKGLIDNAGDFNNYIIEQDKSGVIRVGTFSVTKGSSYQEILKTITSRE